MPKRKKVPQRRRFTQLDIPGLELVEAGDEDYADGYEWYALVTDLDMDAMVFLLIIEFGTSCHIREKMSLFLST